MTRRKGQGSFILCPTTVSHKENHVYCHPFQLKICLNGQPLPESKASSLKAVNWHTLLITQFSQESHAGGNKTCRHFIVISFKNHRGGVSDKFDK